MIKRWRSFQTIKYLKFCDAISDKKITRWSEKIQRKHLKIEIFNLGEIAIKTRLIGAFLKKLNSRSSAYLANLVFIYNI